MTSMKTTTTSINAAAVQDPAGQEQQGRDAYRTPRLVTLGTTVRLVQGGAGFQHWDGGRGYYR